MKQWVKDILEDSTYILDYKNGASTAEVDYQTFAETIVWMCANICEKVGVLEQNEDTGKMYANAIKEHFGVKE